MKGLRPLSTLNVTLTWLLVALMAEPQANVLGQPVSPYARALEVVLAQTAPVVLPIHDKPIVLAQASSTPIELLSAANASAAPLNAASATDTNLLLNLTRTPITLTNGNQLLALSFFSDSNHNYVVEFRDELGLDLCNNWQPLTNAPHNYGIVFTEANITNRFYRLRRIDVPRSPLFALLANDTGTNSLDGITSDPTLMGMALRFPGGTELRASIDHPGGPYLAITNLGAPRHFIITREMLNTIQGEQLRDGSHTVFLRAEQGGQTLATHEVSFVLDTLPPRVQVGLSSESDTTPLNDGRTAMNPVTLRGQTEPGTRLELLAAAPPESGGQSGWVVHNLATDTSGAFVLTNVVLAEGTNQFYFRALDAACNETNVLTQICWYGPNCTFPDKLDGWQVYAAPTPGTAGSVAVVTDKSCTAVMTEGDSFLVTLSREFIIPTLPSTLNIIYSVDFDPTATGAIRDAFEIALVDVARRPLTYTIQGTNAATPASQATPDVLPPSPDACFNLSDGLDAFHADGTALHTDAANPALRRLSIDVSHLSAGESARMVLRLVNNDGDRATKVRIIKVWFNQDAPLRDFDGSDGSALARVKSQSTTVYPDIREPDTTSGLIDDAHYRALTRIGVASLFVEVGNVPPSAPAGGAIALSGVAGYSDGALGRAERVSMTVNGIPVDALDAAGNFFTTVSIREGQNDFSLSVEDNSGASASVNLTVIGTSPSDVNTSTRSQSVSASVEPLYGRTSFNEWTKVLYADLALRNVGTYPIRAPFHVGVTRMSDPSVRLLAPDGVSADGIPYYDFSDTLNSAELNKCSASLPRALAFHNPNKVQFTYELAVLGQLNQAPYFTTTPVLEAIVGKPYTYSFLASDPDGDSLTYSIDSAPTGMVLNAETRTLGFVPRTNDLGLHDITLGAEDGRGGNVQQHFVLNVINQPSNRPPVFTTKPVTTASVVRAARLSENLIKNGNFENTTLPSGGGYAYGAGSTQISNWVVIRGVVTYSRGLQSAFNGESTVHFNRAHSEAGGIEQSFPTLNGKTYEVELHFAGYPREGPPIKSMRVEVAGQSTEVSHDVQGQDPLGFFLEWQRVQFRFVANSNITTLRLYSVTPASSAGPVVDDIRVFEIEDVSHAYQYEAGAVDPDGDRITYSLARSPRVDVPIANASFESPLLADNTFTTNFVGWVADSHGVTWNPADANYSTPIPDGQNVVAIDGGVISQRLQAKLAHDTHYLLEAEVGRHKDTSYQSYGISLWAGGVLLTNLSGPNPAAGTFITARVDFNASKGSPVLGKELEIRLKSLGGHVNFDHVRLTSAPSEPPPFGMTIDTNSGAIRWSPSSEQIGNHTVTVVAYDGRGGSNSQTFGVCVKQTDANRAPVIVSPECSSIDFSLGHGLIELQLLDFRTWIGEEVLPGSSHGGESRWAISEDGYTVTQLYNAPDAVLVSDFAASNYVFQGVMRIATPGLTDDDNLGIAFGYQNNGNYYRFWWRNDRLSNERPYMSVEIVSNAQPRNLWFKYRPGWQPERDYIIKLVALDEDYSILVLDGDEVIERIEISDSTFPSGRFGFFVGSQAGSQYERWRFGPAIPGLNAPRILALDPDRDQITYSLATAPKGISIDPTNGVLRAESISYENAGGSIVVRANDSKGGVDEQSYTVNVSSGSSGVIRGLVYQDLNRDGIHSGTLERPSAGQLVFLDLSRDGLWQGCEPIMRTDFQGRFAFSNLLAETYQVRFYANEQWTVISPANGVATVTLDSGTVSNVSLAIYPVGNSEAGQSPSFVSTPPSVISANQTCLYRALVRSAEGYPLSFDLVAHPEGMLVETNQGVVAWRPLLSQLGVYDVVLRVRDGHGGVALQSWQIKVTAPNAAPIITTFPPGPATVGLPYRYEIRAQDAEGDALTFALGSNAPAGIALNAALATTNAAVLSWTPALSNLGTNLIDIVVPDSSGAEARQTFNLEVLPPGSPNRPPVFTSTPRHQTRIGLPYTYKLEANDPDGDPVSFVLAQGAVGMVLTNSETISWRPDASHVGTHTILVRALDARGGSVEQSFALAVSSTLSNSPPIIVSVPFLHATDDQPYAYDLMADDADGDSVLWRSIEAPVGMSLDPVAGSIRWTPTLDQLGTNRVTIEARDTLGASVRQSWSIDVGCVNRPPQITSIPPTSANVGASYPYAVRAEDPDDDAVVFSFVSSTEVPFGMTLTNLTVTGSSSGLGAALIRWTPGTNQTGPHLIRLRARDGRGGEGEQTYTLHAINERANKPPVIVSTPARGASVGRPYSYAVAANDADGDPLTIQLLQAPSGASLIQSTIQWTPVESQFGSHEFIVTARDPSGASASQRFSVLVRANQPPVISSAPRTNAVPGTTYRYDVFASDPDGDALAYALSAPMTSGLSIDNLGRMTWTPTLAQAGSNPVAVTVTDPFGASASQSFTLTVSPDTEPPLVRLRLVEGFTNQVGDWIGKVGSTIKVQVEASDNVAVATRALYLDGTAIALIGGSVGSITTERARAYTLTGVALDAAGNSNSSTRSVTVLDPTVGNQMLVQLDSPTNDAVISVPVDVVVTITNDSPILSYSWGYALLSEVDPEGASITDPAFTILGTSNLPPDTTRLENFVVGRFDPTILNNDTYVIAVGAVGANGTGTNGTAVMSVQGNLKFGEFRLEFTDLAIPVAGVPITIQRVYDSRNSKRVGDFGHGWSLGVQDAVIRESVPLDRSFRPNTRVHLTAPDGRRLGFTFAPLTESASMLGTLFRPRFVADPGIYEKLEVTDEVFSFEGAGILGGILEEVGPYNPDTYFLTTREGTRHVYEQSSGLKNVTDRNGNRLEYTRDGIFHYNAGSAVSDQSVRFIRDARGRIKQIIDPKGKALTYSYDGAGDLRSFADQTTNTTRYFYSASRAHFLTNIVDPLGRSALGLDYDAAGRLKTVHDANGNPISQDFDVTTKAATFTDGNGTVIHTRFDDNGNETYRRIDGVYTNTFAYDANNNLLASTNGRGFSTNYTYDIRGNVTSIRDSLSNLTSIAYNEQNKPLGVTNAIGQKLILGYNSSGQLTQVVNNAGFKTSVSRDAQGRVVSLTDATGTNTTIFDYSNGCACGRPGKVINPDGSFRLYEYNAQGLTNRVVNELGAETLFHHDDAGRLLWMRDPLTNFTQFFYNGPLLTNVVDALGRPTFYEYDALNRTNRIIDAEGGVIEFRHDNNGNRTHVIDAVTNVTTFIYDSANRLRMQIDPLGRTNFFGYDAAGNRTEAIDRNGRKRTFLYDAANRMTNELWWDGTSVVRSIVFGFNELGVQTLAADPAARYEYSYDALNRLERVLSQSAGVPDFTLLYTYTALGQVASVTDNWGVRVGSDYDNRSRLSSRTWVSTLPGAGVDPARVDFAYDVSGNRLRSDRFADLAGTNRIGFTTNAYNRAGIVTNITHLGPASQVLAKYDYNFDAAYQITRWAIGNRLSDFAYDRTGQLTNALNTAQPNENFRIDANGNRLGAQSGGSYVVGGNNQILSDGTNRYAYDAEGNMTSRSNTVTGVLTTYQFDHRNRLVNVLDHNPGGVATQTVAFVYDAINRRLSKTVNAPQNTNVVRFLYNGDDSWADLDGTNAVTARYLHGARIDELLARQRASDGRGWYLTDHLGTVRDLANAAGAVVAHVDYSSFGQVLGVNNPAALDRFLFTGRELDEETGMYFYRARYYSSQLGRFVSSDPIGFNSEDFNLYRYASNSPLDSRDPSGTLTILEFGLVTSIVLGAYFGARGYIICNAVRGADIKIQGIFFWALAGAFFGWAQYWTVEAIIGQEFIPFFCAFFPDQ